MSPDLCYEQLVKSSWSFLGPRVCSTGGDYLINTLFIYLFIYSVIHWWWWRWFHPAGQWRRVFQVSFTPMTSLFHPVHAHCSLSSSPLFALLSTPPHPPFLLSTTHPPSCWPGHNPALQPSPPLPPLVAMRSLQLHKVLTPFLVDIQESCIITRLYQGALNGKYRQRSDSRGLMSAGAAGRTQGVPYWCHVCWWLSNTDINWKHVVSSMIMTSVNVHAVVCLEAGVWGLLDFKCNS